jgi:hypothetical protein
MDQIAVASGVVAVFATVLVLWGRFFSRSARETKIEGSVPAGTRADFICVRHASDARTGLGPRAAHTGNGGRPMRSAISVVRIALAMAALVLGLAVTLAERPTVTDAAHDVPLPAASVKPPPPPGNNHNNHATNVPTSSVPPPTAVVSCGGCVTLVETPPPVETAITSPPVVPQTPQFIPHVPDDVPSPSPPPPPPDTIPVSIAQLPPVDIPTPSEVPTPAPAPVPVAAPGVQFTSGMDADTQTLTVTLLFVVFGGWFYGNRIASRWSPAKDDHDRVSS